MQKLLHLTAFMKPMPAARAQDAQPRYKYAPFPPRYFSCINPKAWANVSRAAWENKTF